MLVYNPGVARADVSTITWTGGAGGTDWHNAGNWDSGTIPTDGDIVIIPTGATVIYSSGPTSITLNCAGELTVSGGSLTLTGASTLYGGTMDGNGDISISGSGSILTWSGGDIQGSGNLTIAEGTQLVKNVASATTLSRTLVNNGNVKVTQNSLKFTGGSQGSGDFTLQGSSNVEFGGGANYTIDGDIDDLGNSGSLKVSDADTNVVFNGSYETATTSVNSGTNSTWNSTPIAIGSLNIFGNAVFNTETTLTSLYFLTGTIGGPGNITITGTSLLGWQGGTIEGTGTLTVGSNGVLPLKGGGEKNLVRDLTNNGTINILGGTAKFDKPVENLGRISISKDCTSVSMNQGYTQTGAGTLSFDIGGASDFKHIWVAQTLSPAGELYINLINDYIPAAGTNFQVLRYPEGVVRTTQFSIVDSSEASKDFEPTYNTGNLTLTVSEAVSDTIPPQWVSSFPNTTNVSETGFDLLVNTNENSTAYYVILDNDATSPSNSQVKAGQDSSGNLVAEGRKGSISLTANTQDTIDIRGLNSDSSYDIYLIAEDTSGNLQTDPVKLEVKTLLGLSSDAEITSFSFVEQTNPATIDSNAGTIDVEVENGAEITDLTATFNLSAGASVKVGDIDQVSGTTPNDFTTSVTYRVLAQDNSTTKDWTVTVTVESEEPAGPFWNKRAPLPTHNYLWDVEYLNGKYMAVGYEGTLLTSPDGTEWDQIVVTAEKDVTLRGITYANGKYVIVGNPEGPTEGRIYSSVDGENWVQSSTIGNNWLYDVTFGNGKFVIVGQGGAIFTSSDGESWSAKDSGTDRGLSAVVYADNLFVTAGSGGTIVSSSDGEAWTSKVINGNVTLWDVTYGDGIFVVVGKTQTGYSYTYSSTNKGESWIAGNGSQTNSGLYAVAYDSVNQRFLATGLDSSMGALLYLISNDGNSWTKKTNSAIKKSFSDMTYVNGNFVAAGTSIYRATITENDAVWTRLTKGVTDTLNGIAYGQLSGMSNPTFVSVGESGSIQTSTDGIQWTIRDSGTNENLNNVKYLNGKLIAVGNKGTILTSDDGVTWNKQTSGVSYNLLDVAYGNGRYVAVGGTYSSAEIILSSIDGVSWVYHDISSYQIPTIIYSNNIFIALGQNGHVWKSSDGMSWQQTGNLTSSGSTYPRKLILADNKLIAVANDGLIYISSDNGSNWTKIDTGSGHYFRSVTYGGGNIVAVGDYGSIYLSFNKGGNWEKSTSSLDIDFQGVVAGTSNFVTVGQAGVTLQSRDFGAPSDPDAMDVAADAEALTFNDIKDANSAENNITSDLNLITGGDNGTSITWNAVPTGWINGTTGEVTRPSSNDGDKIVTMTATISKGLASDTVSFVLTIKATEESTEVQMSDTEAVAADKASLTWESIKGNNTTQDNITMNLINPLPTTGANGTNIVWTVSPTGWISTSTGGVTRPNNSAGDIQVTLTATLSKGLENDTNIFNLKVIALQDETNDGGGTGGGGSSGSPTTPQNVAIITSKQIDQHLDNEQLFSYEFSQLGLEIDPDSLPLIEQGTIRIDVTEVSDPDTLNTFFIQFPNQKGIKKGYNITFTQESNNDTENITDLNGEITLVFKLTPEELEGIDPSTLVVYKQGDDGSITELSGEFDWETSSLSVNTSHLCKFYIMGKEGIPIQRIAGDNRYATAAAISAAGWLTADNIILTSGENFPDALAGTTLAGFKDAPVLLSARDNLNSETLQEIKRLKVKNIYILGGTSIISQSIEDLLTEDYTVTRIFGSNRYETAVKVGQYILDSGNTGADIDTIILTTGSNYPDALSTGPFAGKYGIPILFTGHDSLNSFTAQALTDWDVKKVMLVGGAGVIAEEVKNMLEDEMGMSVIRLGGQDRYLTSLEVVKYFLEKGPVGSEDICNTQLNLASLATGENFTDALTGASLAVKLNMPVLLCGKDQLNNEIRAYLQELKLVKLYIYGEKKVITDEAKKLK